MFELRSQVLGFSSCWSLLGAGLAGLTLAASSAHAAQPEKDPDTLDGYIQKEMAEGFKKTGPTGRGNLASATPFEFKVERGKCYTAIIKLGSESSLSEQAKRKRIGVVSWTDSGNPDASPTSGGIMFDRGAAADCSCPRTTGRCRVGFELGNVDSVDDGSVPKPPLNLGTGPYTVEVLVRAISAKELKERIDESNAQMQDAEEFHQGRRANVCEKCKRDLMRCGGDRHECDRNYQSCLDRDGFRTDQCR